MIEQGNKEEKNLKDLLKGNNNSFIVPEGYFEELPGLIRNNIDALPDFTKTADLNPFSVPNEYFEKLPIAISDKLLNSKKSPIPAFFKKILQPRFSIPIGLASLVLIAAIFYHTQKKNSDPTENEFTIDEIKNSSYFQTIDEDMLADMLPIQEQSTPDDSVEQFLLDNNIEISQIEKEL